MAVSDTREKTTMASVSGSDDYYSLVCNPCHRDEKTVPAFGYCIDCKEHLCNICYTHHKTPTPCRHHRLQDRNAMPSTQRLDTYVRTGSIDNLTTPCPRHKKEMVKLYCRDHHTLLCSICVTLEHNKICHVDYIPDISDKMIDSPDYKHTMDRMDKLLKKCSRIETETSIDTSTSNSSLKTALMELKKYRQDVNKRIDILQKELENKIHIKQHHNDERKETRQTICEDIKRAVQVAYDEMKQLNASKHSDQLFLEVKQAQTYLTDHESTIRSIAEDSIDEYTLIPSQTINDVLHKEKMIGDISVKRHARGGTVAQDQQLVSAKCQTNGSTAANHQLTFTQHQASGSTTSQHQPVSKQHQASGSTTSQHQPVSTQQQTGETSQHKPVSSSVDETTTLTCQGEIIVKLSEDTETCCITGMTMLSPNRLILADSENNSIKLIDVNSKSIISYLSLGTKVTNAPWDITSTTSTQVAVTIPDKHCILFISVSKSTESEKLSKSHTIKTNGQCYSICFHLNKLIVTYRFPGKLEVLDMKGRVKARVTDVFNVPMYVCANDSYIYISEDEAEVITLNWQGKITGRTAYIKYPRGLAVLADGSLLVSDYYRDRVQQVSGDCTNPRTVLQDVRRPLAVCVDDGGHKLFISRDCKFYYDNSILVYNM